MSWLMEPTGGFSAPRNSETGTRTSAQLIAMSLLASPIVVSPASSHRFISGTPEGGYEQPYGVTAQTLLASRSRHHWIRGQWSSGIRLVVLALSGFSKNTGGAEA